MQKTILTLLSVLAFFICSAQKVTHCKPLDLANLKMSYSPATVDKQ